MQSISIHQCRFKNLLVQRRQESLRLGRKSFYSLMLGNNQSCNSIIYSQSLIIHGCHNSNITSGFINSSAPLFRMDQTRHMGRKDGHSAFYKTRPPTKKQRKKYFKRKREVEYEKVGKHSKPGSRAGPLREYEEIERQDLVDKGAGRISRGLLEENAGYNYGDGKYYYYFHSIVLSYLFLISYTYDIDM